MNRAIAVLAGALVTYFVLTFIEKQDFIVFIEFLFGTSADGYVNLRALILIIGMLFIVQICHSSGVFQVIGFKLIQLSNGKPFYLLFVLCSLSLFLSAILNNILTVIILIPLTIVASRILGINPSPYIIAEAIMVNVGGIMFSISSIPNILITTYAGISFGDFFLNVGLFALVLFGITIAFFRFFYRNKLMIPKEKFTKVLQDFNIWNYVPDKRLFYKSIFVLLITMVCFAVIPPTILSSDIIAISGGIGLVIISKLNGREIIKNIDLELILYLLGIFVITGAMESVGVIDWIGAGFIGLTGSNSLVAILFILWASAFLSSTIDNIPITKVLIPIVDVMSSGFTPSEANASYYSLAFGANLGDNLTPLGDNILVMNLAEQNERPITYSQFFKLGFIATIIQLIAISIYFILLNDIIIGMLIFAIFILIFFMGNVLRKLKAYTKKEEELLFRRYWMKLKRRDFITELNLLVRKILTKIKNFIMQIIGVGRK